MQIEHLRVDLQSKGLAGRDPKRSPNYRALTLSTAFAAATGRRQGRRPKTRLEAARGEQLNSGLLT